VLPGMELVLGEVGKNGWFVYTFCYNDLWVVKV
jgi:hypothetical protein